MKLELLENSIPTELIPAWKQARRSRKRRGSVACSEQGKRSGAIRSEPFVRVSRIWPGCFPKDETQWSVNVHSISHDGLGDILIQAEKCTIVRRYQLDRHIFNEKVNGVKSQPKYDDASHNVNMGSPNLVGVAVRCYCQPEWRRSPNSTQRNFSPDWWEFRSTLTGEATGFPTSLAWGYKRSAMNAKDHTAKGKWDSLCIQLTHERRIASAIR